MTTLTCSSFKATPVPGGQIRLEISDPTPDALLDKMSLQEIASAMGKTVKQIDKLSRRAKNPLPILRGNGRPYALRSRLNEWLSMNDRFPIGAGETRRAVRSNADCGSSKHVIGSVYCPDCQP